MSSIASGADASDGVTGDLAEAQHQQAEPRAQGLSVLAARPHHRSPGVGDRALGQREAVNHVHPDAKGIFLLGGDHGLAQQESAELAAVQYDGRDLLRRGPRGSLGPLRPTGDLQQRPGRPVYQHRLHRRAGGRRRPRAIAYEKSGRWFTAEEPFLRAKKRTDAGSSAFRHPRSELIAPLPQEVEPAFNNRKLHMRLPWPASGSAWTAKASAWIMFSSSACGAA